MPTGNLNENRAPGCLVYVGNYTTQLYGDSNKLLQEFRLLTNQYNGKFFFFPWAHVNFNLFQSFPFVDTAQKKSRQWIRVSLFHTETIQETFHVISMVSM